MAKESPLFQSAMELLGHSIEHFNGNSELDRKFVILHGANAVELLLKDLLLDLGESIFSKPKETLSIHSAVRILREKNVSLPGFNKIELLIDERNALQHRYGSPNELTTIFYMDATFDFIRQAVADHYDLDLDEVLPQFTKASELAAFKLRQPSDDSELENLKRLATVHPVGAFLSAMAYQERLILDALEQIYGDDSRAVRFPMSPTSVRMLERHGVKIDEELSRELLDLRRTRNMVSHGRGEPTVAEVEKAVDSIEKLEVALKEVDFEQLRKEHEAERHELAAAEETAG